MATLSVGCQGILDIEDGTLAPDVSISHRSCIGLARTCGPTGTADCCASAVIPAGFFHRSYDGVTYDDEIYPAAVDNFTLDLYEVTVGRFRKFVEAFPRSRPSAGAGKNPNNPDDPGWNPAWNATERGFDGFPPYLPLSRAQLLSMLSKCSDVTWTDTPGESEHLPINCIDWPLAYAFCIWDGGRLPTEAEWNYAAAGGDEQRVYPWGSDPPDDSRAVYCGPRALFRARLHDPDAGDPCSGLPQPTRPGPVGSKSPGGDGKWGHADLAGNLIEWNQDQYFDPYTQVPCINCSNLAPANTRVTRGGSYDHPPQDLMASYREPNLYDTQAIGVRCARNPP